MGENRIIKLRSDLDTEGKILVEELRIDIMLKSVLIGATFNNVGNVIGISDSTVCRYLDDFANSDFLAKYKILTGKEYVFKKGWDSFSKSKQNKYLPAMKEIDNNKVNPKKVEETPAADPEVIETPKTIIEQLKNIDSEKITQDFINDIISRLLKAADNANKAST